ncbi:hypothetical protein DOR57_22700 [Salmonella enterica subsp. salamae]|nr:hypothetical protein [Salmonella enterica subsp. enterica serovar Kottbus]ECG0942686.1 hypothetical protein [Salmonella enterica subsp. salamae]
MNTGYLLRLFMPALCLSLSACSHFTSPPLWQALTGRTSVASSTKTGGKPDATLYPPVVAGTVSSVLPGTIATGSRLAQCRDELRALQGLDMPLWQKNRPVLDDVLAGASRYVVLRPRLSADMRQVMDSVHQAHLARACQQIHADLFSALLKRADNP